MSHIKFITVVVFSLFSAGLFNLTANAATLPSGLYTGFVSNNPFNEWCRLNRAEMNFTAGTNGAVDVMWTEKGISNSPSSGFCENNFDATFTSTGENTWDVDFHWNWGLSFGKAKLEGDILTIDASFTGTSTGYQYFRTRLAIHPENSSLTYERRIDRFGGSTLFANGILYQ